VDGLPHEKRDRARTTQNRVQGHGRSASASAARTARSEEAGSRGRPRGVGETPHGEEGARFVREVPGAGRPVGPRCGRRVPPARGWIAKPPARGASRRDRPARPPPSRRRRLRARGGDGARAAAATSVARLVARSRRRRGPHWRQEYDLELRRYNGRGWRAMFFLSGFEHPLTADAGSAWARSPWEAVQRAAGDALRRRERREVAPRDWTATDESPR